MYLTPGLKFGGQSLVYTGDPLRYHSMYIHTKIDAAEKSSDVTRKITYGDLVALCRIGTGTKKARLITVRIPEKQQFFHITAEWAGF